MGNWDVICPRLGQNPMLNGPGSNLFWICIYWKLYVVWLWSSWNIPLKKFLYNDSLMGEIIFKVVPFHSFTRSPALLQPLEMFMDLLI